MLISFRTLLILAKCKDKEAQRALEHYQALTKMADECLTIRVWVVNGSYQLGLTYR